MKRVLDLLVPTVMAMSLLHSTPAHAQRSGDDRQDVTALMNQLPQARLKADDSFFQKYMAGDYQGIHSDGSTETKQQLVQFVKSGKLKYDKYEMRELKVRMYGDAAVANTLVDLDAIESDGHRSTGQFRTTWVWVKHDGNWECAAFQAARLVPK